jgi:hypothetical protein
MKYIVQKNTCDNNGDFRNKLYTMASSELQRRLERGA